MQKFLTMLMLAVSLSVSAAVGDTTPISASNIVEVKQERSTTSKGKEKVEIIVIYKDAHGKRKLAYMTQSDYKKVEQARKYSVDIEYVLVEGKTRMKMTVK